MFKEPASVRYETINGKKVPASNTIETLSTLIIKGPVISTYAITKSADAEASVTLTVTFLLPLMFVSWSVWNIVVVSFGHVYTMSGFPGPVGV